MKALLATRAGTPDDLTIGELPDPVAGPGQAVVRVEAVALNFFDLLIIAGKYQYSRSFRSRRGRNSQAASKASAPASRASPRATASSAMRAGARRARRSSSPRRS
jgi:NADPH2:quinone reductase